MFRFYENRLLYQQKTEIYYDKELGSIVATYTGVIKYQDWVAHLEYALDLIEKYTITKWLTDTREAKVISSENQKYFSDVFIPSTRHTSMRYIATVVAKDAFNEFGTRQMMTNYKNKKGDVSANNQYFKTIEEAREWLESK